jgi:hypothetical protein
MDENDPAWKLAAAADASLKGGSDILEEAFKALKPAPTTIAQAYALCLTKTQFTADSRSRMILNARLQVALMEEHVAAQRRMGFTINALTWVLVVLTVALVILGAMDLSQKGLLSTTVGRSAMLDISNPCLRWGYFCGALILSVSYGLGCYAALDAPKPNNFIARLHQFWFNTIGAATGWLAAWVVIVRWLSCPSFVCRDEPSGWTILLAVIAFIGITGHLPLAVISSISYLRALLSKLFPQ